ncbi:MAG TPA: toll-Interleukin receptor [Verrucomicrobiae bacterium]|nr:toll-Interleukin receptor [Verrucomicrobiae bacterium]
MKVFISWSGELSHRVAAILNDWIPNVIQNAQPWLSSEDIEKGEIWFGAISEKLSDISIGIICLTVENLNAPWILFEAGSLSKGLTKNRVCTLLIENQSTDLKPPLSQFNWTRPVKADMAKLVETINAVDKDKALPAERLTKAFERWWPDFEERFKAAKKGLTTTATAKRNPEEMIEEILTTVRAIHSNIQTSVAPSLFETEASPTPGASVSAILAYLRTLQEGPKIPNLFSHPMSEPVLEPPVKTKP